MDLIIRNGTIFNSDTSFKADIAIKHGKIVLFGKCLDLRASREIDASGKILVPGGVDVHTHLKMPFMGTFSADDFESGTVAAAYGGTTSIIDFAIQKDKSLLETLEEWQKKALKQSHVDYSFHIAITNANEENICQIDELAKKGVTSIKVFMAYKNAMMLEDDQILRVFRACKKNKILPFIHAENGNIIEEKTKELLESGRYQPKYHAVSRHETVEIEAIQRIIRIAAYANLPIYIAHVSTINGAMEILRSKINQKKVFYETCPHYLLFNDGKYTENLDSAKYVMSPPLRKEYNRVGLRGLIKDGLVDVISTDHCPFYFESQKTMGKNDFSKIPNGVGGIENRMEIMYNELVNKLKASINTYVKCTSTNPAKIFGLYPEKGTLQINCDADIVIIDPKKQFEIHQQSNHESADYSIYEGYQGIGKIDTVIINGKVKVQNNHLIVKEKEGRFVKRKISGSYDATI
jgi:dihydropyrimidinase